MKMARRSRLVAGVCWVALLSAPACSDDKSGETPSAPDGGDARPAGDGATVAEAGGDAGPDAAAPADAVADGGDVAAGITAVMYLPDSLANQIYRYTIAPGVDPVLTATIPLDKAAGAALRSTGELFVASYTNTGIISRFLAPAGTPVANGTIMGLGIAFPQEMRFVDDELWVLNTADHACTTEPQSIVRVAFDAQGAASAAGTITPGLIGANRGLLWVPATRELFVSQCHPVNALQHYRVASDHSVTVLPAITGNGLHNPHAMVLTPWGELLVVNAYDNDILRFTVDAQGAATANGTLVENGMNLPVGMAFAPWGELFVISQGMATVSRFSFDAAHVATASGKFDTNTPVIAQQYGIAWVVIAPAP